MRNLLMFELYLGAVDATLTEIKAPRDCLGCVSAALAFAGGSSISVRRDDLSALRIAAAGQS